MLDKEERIIAVLVGRPDDPQWSDTINAAAEVMQEVEQLGRSMDLFAAKCLHHRRGEFLAIPAGVSFGGGQTVRAWRWLFNAWLMCFKCLPTCAFNLPTSNASRMQVPLQHLPQSFTGTLLDPYRHCSNNTLSSRITFPTASFRLPASTAAPGPFPWTTPTTITCPTGSVPSPHWVPMITSLAATSFCSV